MAKVYIGTSGFYYAHWLKDFYPPGIQKENLLDFYSQQFNTVEINSSFYHIPRETTVENWASKVDNEFVFSFKASRIITHLKKFNVDRTLIDTILTPLQSRAQKPAKDIILFQTPGNLKANNEKLQNLLSLLPETFLYAFEFRHETWFNEEIYELLRKYNASLVLSDGPLIDNQPKWPYHDIDTANFFYIRFHGRPNLYVSSYSDEDLKHYAELIQTKLQKNMNVYCYFNNDAEGWAVENAKRLISYLK